MTQPGRHPERTQPESGGSFRRAEAGSEAGATDIEARIVALGALTTADLRIEWRRLYRTTPPTRLSRDLLIRGVAYRIQIGAEGGLSPAAKRRLHALSEGANQRGKLAEPAPVFSETRHQAGSRMASAGAYGQRPRQRVRVSGRALPLVDPDRHADHWSALVGAAVFRDQQAAARGGRSRR